jgi:hypothetical protein
MIGKDFIIKFIQIFLSLLIVIVSVGLALADPWLFYKYGLGGGNNYFGIIFFLIPLLWVGVFFLMLCQFGMFIGTICVYGLKNFVRTLVLMGVCIITVCASLFFTIIKSPATFSFSEGFRDRIKRDVNID